MKNITLLAGFIALLHYLNKAFNALLERTEVNIGVNSESGSEFELSDMMEGFGEQPDQLSEKDLLDEDFIMGYVSASLEELGDCRVIHPKGMPCYLCGLKNEFEIDGVPVMHSTATQNGTVHHMFSLHTNSDDDE